MKGFKDFLMQGNLVELAVAFIIGSAFAAVVTAFTGMIMDLIGKIGGTPDFSSVSIGGISVGKFLTALLAFVIIAAVVYFLVVKPYEALKARLRREEPEAVVTSEELLAEIRDLLLTQQGGQGPQGPSQGQL